MIIRPPIRPNQNNKIAPNRYFKLASAKNPDTDYIELNDLQGFLCTSFKTIGINRQLGFLAVENRQFVVENKPNFKKYNLTIEILSKYSEYEAKHRQLISFLDRNKICGLRLYYKPYKDVEKRWCYCDIESSVKVEKLQPVLLTLSQGSLWFGVEQKATTVYVENEIENLFAFQEDKDNDGYYSAKFGYEDLLEEYCISFFSNFETSAVIVNDSYNKIPLTMRVYGRCVNPILTLYKKDENEPIRQTQVFATISNDFYLEIVSSIDNNGVWLVNKSTGERRDYTELINNALGSPYFYVDNGEYSITVEDDGNNVCLTDIFYQGEYSE